VREYPPLPESVPRARRHARHVLGQWGFGAIAADAELALSELLSNAERASAVLPSRPGVRVRLLADPGQVMIEVLDRAPGRPVRMAPTETTVGGTASTPGAARPGPRPEREGPARHHRAGAPRRSHGTAPGPPPKPQHRRQFTDRLS